MSDWNDDGWNRDRNRNPRRGDEPERGTGRSDFSYDNSSDRGYGQGTRWGSGDYRASNDRDWRPRSSGWQGDIDREEYSGQRGSGFLGGDHGRIGRAPASGMGPNDYVRDPEFSGGYGRSEEDRGADFGGDYARSGGSDFRHSSYTSGGAGQGRTSGSSGNYGAGGGFGSGLGRGTMRDYEMMRDAESAPGQDYGVGRGQEPRRQTSSMSRPSFRGRGPKGFQRSDERVREMVCERLHDHDDIDASDIEVTVTDGEVTLAGTVDDRRTKVLAESVAETVSGVTDVHNSLKVDRGFFTRMAEKVRDAVAGEKSSH